MSVHAECGAVTALRDEIHRWIAERWRAYFPDRAGGPAPTVTCASRAGLRRYSVLLEYALEFGGTGRVETLIAKVRREGRLGDYDPGEMTARARQLARLEFDQLRAAYAYFVPGGDGVGVVRPLDYLTECNAILVEKACGQDLGLLVQSNRADCRPAIRRCGRWLRSFHDGVHRTRARAWEPAEYERAIADKSRRLRGHGVSGRRLEALGEAVVGSARSLAPARVPWSILHGDCKLRHVWASPTGIQVLDFGNVHEGDCYRDVAAFLIELEVLALGRPWFDATRIAAYSAAFLGGYFGDDRPPAILRLYVADALLKKWDRRLRAWSAHPVASRLQRWLRQVQGTRLVDRLYLDRWFEARVRTALNGTDHGGL